MSKCEDCINEGICSISKKINSYCGQSCPFYEVDKYCFEDIEYCDDDDEIYWFEMSYYRYTETSLSR